jgi:hypothetical protein
MSEKIKHGKPDTGYLFEYMPELLEVIKALEHGAIKYSRDNYKNVDWKDFRDAAARHLFEIGESDTGNHYAQAIADLLIIMRKERENEPETRST